MSQPSQPDRSLEASKVPAAARSDRSTQKLLEVRDLKVHFPIKRGFLQRTVGAVKAVDGVSFDVLRGETLGLVGESGCGKTTLGRTIMRIYQPTAGEMRFHSEQGEVTDLATLQSHTDLLPYRRQIRMVFQDPHSSLNPRMTVRDIISEPLKVIRGLSGSDLDAKVVELLRRVGLRAEYLHRYPHAFSGGERQRIGIARALALEPTLVVADEAVSALDVSVQAQILNLLRELQDEFDLTYLFVAHDLSVVEHLADRVAVMYVGRLVEVGSVEDIFSSPKHPYTEALLSAVPIPDPRSRGRRERIRLEGEVADPANQPSGCLFHPRCQYAQDRCVTEKPELRPIGGGQYAACHFSETLDLKGV